MLSAPPINLSARNNLPGHRVLLQVMFHDQEGLVEATDTDRKISELTELCVTICNSNVLEIDYHSLPEEDENQLQRTGTSPEVLSHPTRH